MDVFCQRRRKFMDDKRAAILTASLDLISERGFHNTPVSLISQEAGVSAGIIYHYFDNKEDMIDELYKKAKFDLVQAMLDGYSEELPLRERFRIIWLNTVRYYLRHPKETAFMEQYANSPFLKPETEDAFAEYFEPITEFMAYATREGVIKQMPTQMLATFTLEVAISLAKKHASGELLLDDNMLEMAIDASWDAIKR
jgi:AcrR family transcriptional regulator